MYGKARFICVAETFDVGADEQGCLRGTIYVVSEAGRWQCIVRRALQECFSVLDAYSFERDPKGIEHHYGHRKLELDALLSRNCAFQAQFCLRRNGVVDLIADDKFRRAYDAPEYPSGILLSTVSAQLFSFLRDVGHKHQHHHPTTDTIVDLHELSIDDYHWRQKTLYSIYRRIITFKRQSDIVVQIRSIGLLAYAKAFKKIWLEDRPYSKDLHEIPVYYDDALQQSIQSSDLRMRYKSQERDTRNGVFRTTAFSLLGAAISLAGLIRIVGGNPLGNVEPSPFLLLGASLLVREPLLISGLITAVATFIVLVISRKNIRPTEWPFVRYVQALLQPLKRRYVLLITMLSAAIFLGLAAFLY